MLFAVRSDTTPYAKQNGGPFNFIFDGHGNALPDDQVIWTPYVNSYVRDNP